MKQLVLAFWRTQFRSHTERESETDRDPTRNFLHFLSQTSHSQQNQGSSFVHQDFSETLGVLVATVTEGDSSVARMFCPVASFMSRQESQCAASSSSQNLTKNRPSAPSSHSMFPLLLLGRPLLLSLFSDHRLEHR